MENSVKKALIERRLTIGTWIQIGHSAISEILSNVGFDWIATDCEHSDIQTKGFTDIARGMHGRGAVPFVRVRENDTLAIRQVLDLGAMGVIVPLVNSAEEARKAVRAAKYPPHGDRGFSYCRMNNWGVDFDDYVRTANENVAVVVMIESKQAVDRIDEILDIEGVDGVFIGPYDMSGSFDIIGQINHPIIQNACGKVAKACAAHKKSAGLHIIIPTPETVKKAIDEGITFIALGSDAVFLNQIAKKTLDDGRQIIQHC